MWHEYVLCSKYREVPAESNDPQWKTVQHMSPFIDFMPRAMITFKGGVPANVFGRASIYAQSQSQSVRKKPKKK